MALKIVLKIRCLIFMTSVRCALRFKDVRFAYPFRPDVQVLWPSGNLVISVELRFQHFFNTYFPSRPALERFETKATRCEDFQFACYIKRGAISIQKTKYCANTLRGVDWHLKRPVMLHDFVLVACCTCGTRGVNSSAMWRSIPCCRSWKEFHSLWKPEHLPDWWDLLAAERVQSWWFGSIGHVHFVGDVAFGLASSTVEAVLPKFKFLVPELVGKASYGVSKAMIQRVWASFVPIRLQSIHVLGPVRCI